MKEYDYGRRRCRFSKTLILSFVVLFNPISMIMCISLGMLLLDKGGYGPYVAIWIGALCSPFLIISLLIGICLLLMGIASQRSICGKCGECAARKREKQKGNLCKKDKNKIDLCNNIENKQDL